MVKSKKHLEVNYPEDGDDTTLEYEEDIDDEISRKLKAARNKPLKKKVVRI